MNDAVIRMIVGVSVSLFIGGLRDSQHAPTIVDGVHEKMASPERPRVRASSRLGVSSSRIIFTIDAP